MSPGYSDKARKNSRVARSIKVLLGQGAYDQFLRTGVVPTADLNAARKNPFGRTRRPSRPSVNYDPNRKINLGSIYEDGSVHIWPADKFGNPGHANMKPADRKIGKEFVIENGAVTFSPRLGVDDADLEEFAQGADDFTEAERARIYGSADRQVRFSKPAKRKKTPRIDPDSNLPIPDAMSQEDYDWFIQRYGESDRDYANMSSVLAKANAYPKGSGVRNWAKMRFAYTHHGVLDDWSSADTSDIMETAMAHTVREDERAGIEQTLPMLEFALRRDGYDAVMAGAEKYAKERAEKNKFYFPDGIYSSGDPIERIFPPDGLRHMLYVAGLIDVDLTTLTDVGRMIDGKGFNVNIPPDSAVPDTVEDDLVFERFDKLYDILGWAD